MKPIRWIGSGLAALALAGAVCVAQTPAGPPKPGPEHQKLAHYIGTWTGKAEMKESPFGPGGTMTWTENCSWFDGNFHVVCHSEGKAPTGPMKGLAIIGYDAEKKLYTYTGIDNSGWADHATGTLEDNVWTFTSSGTIGGKPFHGRFTITAVGDKQQTFKWEMSEDGRTWNTMMTGESSR